MDFGDLMPWTHDEAQVRRVILAWIGIEQSEQAWQVLLDELSRREQRIDTMRASALRVLRDLELLEETL